MEAAFYAETLVTVYQSKRHPTSQETVVSPCSYFIFPALRINLEQWILQTVGTPWWGISPVARPLPTQEKSVQTCMPRVGSQFAIPLLKGLIYFIPYTAYCNYQYNESFHYFRNVVINISSEKLS
jgi:hypothetical protein